MPPHRPFPLGRLATRLARELGIANEIPSADAKTALASFVDLHGSVEIARALGARVPPGIPEEKREEAAATRERLKARIATIARSAAEAKLTGLPGVPHLSPATVLASIRVAGVVEDRDLRSIDRAGRALWSPFMAALARRVSRAQADLDAIFTEEAGALASIGGRAAYVLALDAMLDRVTDAGVAPVIDRIGDLLARRFRSMMEAAVKELPPEPQHADVAPWIAPGGFLETQVARGESLLRALIDHRVARAHALVDAATA
ncbi:MAG: hypothetical protein ACXWUG_02050 [Polyangiales bacterium]